MTDENTLVAGLRRAGAKMTAQRLAICDYLDGNDRHPTAAEVYEVLRPQFPTMSLATVYNTLGLLAELDLIHEVGATTDGSARYDPNMTPHLNLICMRCADIIDVEDVNLAPLEELSRARGFRVADVNVAVHGLCAKCQLELELEGQGQV